MSCIIGVWLPDAAIYREDSRSSETNSAADSQEIARLSRNVNIHENFHNTPPLISALSQTSPKIGFPYD
jgi:hypothetical protein